MKLSNPYDGHTTELALERGKTIAIKTLIVDRGYKGITGDNINVMLAATAFNFKRMMNK